MTDGPFERRRIASGYSQNKPPRRGPSPAMVAAFAKNVRAKLGVGPAERKRRRAKGKAARKARRLNRKPKQKRR